MTDKKQKKPNKFFSALKSGADKLKQNQLNQLEKSEFNSFDERLQKVEEFAKSSNLLELQTAFNIGHPLYFMNSPIDFQHRLYQNLEKIVIKQISVYKQENNVEQLQIKIESLKCLNEKSYVVLDYRLRLLDEQIKKLKTSGKSQQDEQKKRIDLLNTFNEFKQTKQYIEEEKEEFLYLNRQYDEMKQSEQKKTIFKRCIMVGRIITCFFFGFFWRKNSKTNPLMAKLMQSGLLVLMISPIIY